MPKKNRKRRTYIPKSKPFQHAKKDHRFHQTALWTNTRKAKVMANSVCEACDHFGLTSGVDCVDHIIRIHGHGGALTDPLNLMSLCQRCHDWKSDKERRGLCNIPTRLNDDGEKIPKDLDDVFEFYVPRFER